MKIRRVLAGLMTVIMTVGQLYVPTVAKEEDKAVYRKNPVKLFYTADSSANADELLMGYLLDEAGVTNEYSEYTISEDEESSGEEAACSAIKARESLNDLEKKMYDLVVEAYRKVADGECEDTEAYIDFPDEIKNQYYSSDQLDNIEMVVDGYYNEEAIYKICEKIGFDTYRVNRAIETDYPHLIYWIDYRAGYYFCILGDYRWNNTKNTYEAALGKIYVAHSAGEAYRPDGATPAGDGFYMKVDIQKTAAGKRAIQNAGNIVTAAMEECSTDEEILKYYCVELCKMTAYNTPATVVTNGANYDGAHSVIYALDGNPETDVVCDGYARTYQLLCDMTEFHSDDVGVYRITGDAYGDNGDGGGHAWNIAVMDDGKAYHIDSTWSDYEYDEYFDNLTDEQIESLLTRYFLLPFDDDYLDEENNSYRVTSRQVRIEHGGGAYSLIGGGTETCYLSDDSIRFYPISFFDMATDNYTYIPAYTFNNGNTTVTVANLTYTGDSLDPGITVKFGEDTLTKGTDYTLTIKKNGAVADEVRNAGTYTAVISGKGEYSGSVSKDFTVAAKSITPTISVSGTYTYNGNVQAPQYTVKDNSTVLTKDVDYTAVIGNNTDAGQGTITVSAVEGGNYSFSNTVGYFTIGKANAAQPADIPVYVIKTAGSATATITGMPSDAGSLRFEKGASSVTGSASVTSWSVTSAGVVTVNFTGGAAGDVIKLPVTVESKNYTDITINVLVTLQDKNGIVITLTEGNTIGRTYGDADLTLHPSQSADNSGSGIYSYSSSVENVATVDASGKIHISGAGSTTITVVYESDTHRGSVNISVVVSKKTLTIEWSKTQLVYNGTEQGPTVRYSGRIGDDDILVNMSGKKTVPGNYSALLSLSGTDADKYAIADADTSCSYTISKANISDATITVDDTVTYNGAEQTAAVLSVMLNGNDIKGYCTVTGNKQTNAGSYTMTVSAKADSYYTGSVSVQYSVKRKIVNPSVMNDGSFVYTGEEIRPDIMVRDGSDVLTDKDIVISYSDNINAGIARITIDPAEDGNYYFTRRTVMFTITKAVIPDKKISESNIYGATASLDLSGVIMSGGVAVIESVSDNNAILGKEPLIKDGKLEYAFKDDETLAGNEAVICIAVSGCSNYEDYEIEVRLSVLGCTHADILLKGVLEANCTEEGYTGDKYCRNCGKLLEKGSVLPIDPDKHDYDEGTITKEATAFEEGVKTYRCRRCGHERTEVIDCIELDEDMSEDLSEVMEDMDPETDKVEVSKKDNEDGSSETVISVGDEEVSRTETDADGNIVEESKIWVAGLKSSYIYCGEAIKPEIHVYDGLRRLVEGSDYSVAFKNNKKSGKEAKLVLSFKGSYKLTEKKEFAFEIKPAELGKDVIAQDGAVNVGGKPVANVLFVESGKKVPAKDLEITYSGDTAAAGTITVSIKPSSSDYSGSTQAVITVTDNKVLMLENAKVKTEQKKYTYTGEPVSANVIVVLDGKELKKGIDYTVSQISNNVEPGTATMVLEAIKGNPEGYIGSKVVTYKIVKGRMLEKGNGFRIEMSEKQTYEKGGVKPVLKVYDGDTLLKEGVDYKLSIKGNKKAGRTGTVTVRGKGKYKGSVNLNFAVEASDISKLTVVSADAVMSPKNADPGAVIIDTNKKQLKEGVDYRIVQDPTSPVGGKYMDVIAKGIGNYNGEVRIWYRDIETSKNVGKIKNVKIPAVPYAPGGTTIDKKTLEGLFGGELVYGRDYVAAGYINNTKPGTAKLVVKGTGNYGGVRLISFKISAKKGVIKGAYREGGWK